MNLFEYPKRTSMEKILIYSDDDKDRELIHFVLKPYRFDLIDASAQLPLPTPVEYAFISLSLPPIEVEVTKSTILIATPDQTIELMHHEYPQALITLVAPLKRSDLSRVLELLGINTQPSANLFNQLIDLRIYLKQASTKVINAPILSESLYEGLMHFCLYECGRSKKLDKDQSYQHGQLLHIAPQGHIKICLQKESCLVHQFIKYLEELSPESKKLLHAPLIELIGDPLALSFDQLAKNIDDYIHHLLSIRRHFCCHSCQHAKHDVDFKAGDQVLVEMTELIKGHCVYCRYESCALSNVFKHFSDYLGTIK